MGCLTLFCVYIYIYKMYILKMYWYHTLQQNLSATLFYFWKLNSIPFSNTMNNKMTHLWSGEWLRQIIHVLYIWQRRRGVLVKTRPVSIHTVFQPLRHREELIIVHHFECRVDICSIMSVKTTPPHIPINSSDNEVWHYVGCFYN